MAMAASRQSRVVSEASAGIPEWSPANRANGVSPSARFVETRAKAFRWDDDDLMAGGVQFQWLEAVAPAGTGRSGAAIISGSGATIRLGRMCDRSLRKVSR